MLFLPFGAGCQLSLGALFAMARALAMALVWCLAIKPVAANCLIYLRSVRILSDLSLAERARSLATIKLQH